ncbi:hypothetical protein [Paenibacillus alvei]|nr:hypothetical protein [Paenibacillus alvei]
MNSQNNPGQSSADWLGIYLGATASDAGIPSFLDSIIADILDHT